MVAALESAFLALKMVFFMLTEGECTNSPIFLQQDCIKAQDSARNHGIWIKEQRFADFRF
jgi:hypothetical protein